MKIFYAGGITVNIYDKANEFANILKNAPEVVEYRDAMKKLNANPTNKKMVDDFRKKQFEIYSMQMQGIQVSQEQMNIIENLGKVISMNPEIMEFMQSEYKFSVMWEDINKILGEAIGIDKLETPNM